MPAFDHFTTTRKLGNLLWVYGPNHGDKVAAYYPGDKFADVVGLDIAGTVSPASDAAPATTDELSETVRQIKAYGRRSDAVTADIRDIAAPRAAADRVDRGYGKIDIVVANAAIQRWMPLLEMQDSDWRNVIDNNLNGTANTVRAFALNDGEAQLRTHDPAVLDAGQARDQGRLQLLGIQVGHIGPDEIRGSRVRAVWHHRQRSHSRPR